MNKLIYFSVLKRAFYSDKLFIRNNGLPLCINCKYFIEDKNNYFYDGPPSDEINGKCKKTGQINVITGVIEYDSASESRNNIKKCGRTGQFFRPKQ